MPLDLLTALFVFMLAAFLGLDIIRRVSRLLHTPLMSLTNAISSIAVVGALILAGEADGGLTHLAGRHRRVRVHHQPRERLPDHRPDASDVQAPRGVEVVTRADLFVTATEVLYLDLRRAVHPGAALDEPAGDRPPRRRRRGHRHGAGGRRHAAPPGNRHVQVDRDCGRRGHAARHPARARAAHGRAGTNRPVAGVRRPGGRARRHREVLLVARARRADALPHGHRRGRSHPRLPHLHGRTARGRQARRVDDHAAGHLSRPEHRQFRSARRRGVARRVAHDGPDAVVGVSDHHRARARPSACC